MARFAFLVLAAILYGSLYPFAFSAGGGIGEAIDHLLRAWPVRSSLPDVAANVLLYLPFGVAVSAAAAPWIRRPAAIAAAVLSGAAVGTAVELAQHFLPARVVNPVDILCNAAGSLLGALAGIVLARGPVRGLERPAVGDRAAALLAAAWLVDRLWPFVPTLDVQQVKDALKPLLLHPTLDAAELIRHAACWFGFALLARAALPMAATRARVTATILAVPFAALFVHDRTVSLSAALGAAAGAAFWLGFAARPERAGARLLAALMAATVLAVGLAPYSFAGPPRDFSWVPFHGFVAGTLAAAVASFLTKSFLFGTLVWALARAGAPVAAAGGAASALLAAIGWAQTYLPARSASITDAVIALCFACVIHWLRETPPARTAPAATVP